MNNDQINRSVLYGTGYKLADLGFRVWVGESPSFNLPFGFFSAPDESIIIDFEVFDGSIEFYGIGLILYDEWHTAFKQIRWGIPAPEGELTHEAVTAMFSSLPPEHVVVGIEWEYVSVERQLAEQGLNLRFKQLWATAKSRLTNQQELHSG